MLEVVSEVVVLGVWRWREKILIHHHKLRIKKDMYPGNYGQPVLPGSAQNKFYTLVPIQT